MLILEKSNFFKAEKQAKTKAKIEITNSNRKTNYEYLFMRVSFFSARSSSLKELHTKLETNFYMIR